MNGFFNRLQHRFAEWMRGRRGVDRLSNALVIVGVALIVANMLTGFDPLSWLALVALVIAVARSFSRNITAREREDEAYEVLMAKPRALFSNAGTAWKNRKTTAYFKCKGCGTVLSVPRGKGTIRVTCPKCHTQEVRKS